MGWFRRNEHDEEQLSAYLDGELDARQAENVERHLSSCAACSALLEELRETRALLSALPAQAPPRSFVLGAEYARASVRDVARPSKRFNLALAPALALTVFVALVFVDLTNSTSSTTSDESPSTLSMATARQAGNDAIASDAAGSELAPPPAGTVDSSAGGAGSTGKNGPTDTAPVAPQANDGSTTETPTTMSAGLAPPEPTSGAGAAAASQPSDASPPQPQGFEAPDTDNGDGISTLRILEIVAGLVFLASGFYVFMWPRLSRGGS